MELRADIDTLDAQLSAERLDHANEISFREKLQGERDEMRALLDTKTSEETRRDEVERSKERELADLRSQTSQLYQELTDLRRTSLESQNKLRLDLEQSNREHISLQHSHKSLLDRERATQSQLSKTQSQLSDLEKAKRAMESEFQSIKSRQSDIQNQLSDALRVKEVFNLFLLDTESNGYFQGLERQLATAQGKYQNFEDVVLEFQRDQETRLRELETARKQLEREAAKRAQLEKASSNQKAEIAKLKDHNAKLDRDLTNALNDLKAREWDVKQLLSKQDKTIVEHVHVLEEAKRVTDRLLQEAQLELRRNDKFIRSLQSAKTKMASEAEDMAVKNERELRTKEKEVKMQQEKVTQALLDVEKEQKGKEEAELQIRRLQYELQQVHHHAKDVEAQLLAVQQSKSTLENEVDRLAGEAENGGSLATMQRQYESYDELQLQYDDEFFKNGGWRKEKERLKTKIADLEKLYEASTGAQTEQQSQIMALHSQVRELRGVLDDAEADRTLLQKARRALQGELEMIKLDHVDTNKIASDHEFQKLQLKKQDLERSLEEQEDRVSNAFDRTKKAESFAYQCQIELGKTRVENSELGKLNVCLDF